MPPPPPHPPTTPYRHLHIPYTPHPLHLFTSHPYNRLHPYLHVSLLLYKNTHTNSREKKGTEEKKKRKKERENREKEKESEAAAEDDTAPTHHHPHHRSQLGEITSSSTTQPPDLTVAGGQSCTRHRVRPRNSNLRYTHAKLILTSPTSRRHLIGPRGRPKSAFLAGGGGRRRKIRKMIKLAPTQTDEKSNAINDPASSQDLI
jgi:hypothetical protein